MIEKQGIRQSFSLGPYNKSNNTEQWIRISQGCPNQCPYCYEPREEKVFGIPEIIRNKVKIMDMNLLSKPRVLQIISELGRKRVGGRVVHYELICGIDWRFLSIELADALKKARFKKIRIGWDLEYQDQFKIRRAIQLLRGVGYSVKEITIFMLCNWEIPYKTCIKKLYLCAVWNVKVADCYFDGQVSPNIKPLGWTAEQITDFRSKVRKHNQLVNFGIDPEIKQLLGQAGLF